MLSFVKDYNYSVFLFFSFFFFSCIFILLPFIFSKNKSSSEKISAYECGVEPLGASFKSFGNVQFFLISVLFLIFDLEIVFLLPWAVSAGQLHTVYGLLGFIPFYVFFLFLILGYFFEWSSGSLDWSFGDLKN